MRRLWKVNSRHLKYCKESSLGSFPGLPYSLIYIFRSTKTLPVQWVQLKPKTAISRIQQARNELLIRHAIFQLAAVYLVLLERSKIMLLLTRHQISIGLFIHFVLSFHFREIGWKNVLFQNCCFSLCLAKSILSLDFVFHRLIYIISDRIFSQNQNLRTGITRRLYRSLNQDYSLRRVIVWLYWIWP